jgi:hypothetical protein
MRAWDSSKPVKTRFTRGWSFVRKQRNRPDFKFRRNSELAALAARLSSPLSSRFIFTFVFLRVLC